MSDDAKTEEATMTIIDGSALPLPPGEHVVHAVIDTTTPIAPENIFLPTENPDGTWTTKVPVGHPSAGVVIGRVIDRALSPEDVAGRVPLVIAAADIRTILLRFPRFQRVDVLSETGVCRDCGDDVGEYRCQCANDE